MHISESCVCVQLHSESAHMSLESINASAEAYIWSISLYRNEKTGSWERKKSMTGGSGDVNMKDNKGKVGEGRNKCSSFLLNDG